ncbi:MAG: CHAT domain-containing protein [Deltaproteobacteria bacterium]|nr:CHAT domain-containing protein [Deltaproteobacteria bacterium]
MSLDRRSSSSTLLSLAALAGGCALLRGEPPWVPSVPSEGSVPGIERPEDIAFFPGDELSPSASLDGRYVAFVSSETGNLDIWVRDFRTDATFPITDDPGDDFDPAFAPDGEGIVFASRRHDAKGDLFLGSIEGGAERLTDGSSADRQPIFSHDGAKLYFTRAGPFGLESVAELDLGSRTTRTLSPTPGFDPAPAPDGRHLVYTAPAGTGGRPHPHLVLLDLVSGSTRAVTRGEDPAGFARFCDSARRPGALALIFVRFADDDDGDGETDSRDQASLWRVEVDPEDPNGVSEPEPVTAGNADELFPEPRGPWLYFTATTDLGQNVVRLPLDGMYPNLDDPAEYVELGRTLSDHREAWFADRMALARAEPGSLTHARATLDAANLLVEVGRPWLARRAFASLVEASRRQPAGSKVATLGGIARVEALGIDRLLELGKARTPRQRERVLRTVEGSLDQIGREFAASPRVTARVDLERAEVLVDRGERAKAVEAFARVARDHGDVPYSAAKAMIRRTELLAAAFDPETLGLAYEDVIRRFPGERQWVQRAAEHLVAVATEAERRFGEPERDALRRIAMRTSNNVVRGAVRRRLAIGFEREHRLSDAAAELSALVREATETGDRASASSALVELARILEAATEFDQANEAYRELLARYSDLPGVADAARSAITRVNTQKASIEEHRGARDDARRSYQAVIANDFNQVRAHRRYIALSAMTGHAEEVLEETRQVSAARERSPVAHLAYALALTWQAPPSLDEALEEAEVALGINPQFVGAYLARGWIHEMMDLDDPKGDHLERAIEDYQVAARLNPEASDRVTEAEILLDLSNARWRLAAKTHDGTNFRSAFQDYVERLRANVPFDTPESEMVFYERLGRAAIWDGEYAVSAMATREALRLAEEIGRVDRLAQLYGNLALAYSQGGEDEYAGEAFESFANEMERLGELDRLAIARRNRAITILSGAEATGAGDVRAALVELARARADAKEKGVRRGSVPFSVVSQVPDASRAPFGFDEAMERVVNLAWAQRGHALLSETSRVDGLRDERIRLLREIFDDLDLVPLGLFRELLGLELGRARAACRQRAAESCLRELARIAVDVAQWVESGKFDEKDAAAILADRARLEALRAEELAGMRDELELAPLVPGLLAGLDAGLDGTRAALFAIPEVVTASRAFELEGSIASDAEALRLGMHLPPMARDLLSARARVLAARGLVRIASATNPAPGAEVELPKLLEALDGSVAAIGQARDDFERARRAAIVAADSGAFEVVVAALDGVRTADELAGSAEDRTHELFLEAIGRGVVGPVLRRRLVSNEAEQLVQVLTSSIAPVAAIARDSRLLQEALSRSASAAIARGDLSAAFDAIDRSLLFAAVAGTGIPGSAGSQRDRSILASMASAWRAMETAHSMLEQLPPSADSDERSARRQRYAAARARLATLRASKSSDALRARVAAEPVGVDLFELDPDEALLVAAPIGSKLHLFLVDGSTTAETPLRYAESELSTREVERLVRRLRTAAKDGGRPRGTASRLESALLDPFREILSKRRALVLADSAIGGPVPALLFDSYANLAYAHVAAPTGYAVARSARFVAEPRKLVIRADVRSLLRRAPDGDVLEGQAAIDALSMAARKSFVGKSSALVDRPISALVIEAPVQLERGAPERSAIGLVRSDAPEDAVLGEVALEQLRLPAQTLVLREVNGEPSKALDLGLSLLGFPSTVVMPSSVPEEVRRRVADAFLRDASTLGPAQALAAAIRPELDETPSTALISLHGSPGLNAERARALAEQEVGGTRQIAGALKDKLFEDAGLLLVRRFDGQLASKKTQKLEQTCLAMFNVLADSLGDYARAASTQLACLREIERLSLPPAELAATRLRLAETYSKASEFDEAAKLYSEAIDRYRAIGNKLEVARAELARAEHHKRRKAYKEEADAYEAVVSDRATLSLLLEKDPKLAQRALKAPGSVYLKRLSDNEGARRAFQRLLDHSKKPSERVSASIDLARVARSAGEFDEALERADSARGDAVRIKRKDLELAAVIEAANVAWYQGDYARGHALCREGDTLANANLAAARKSTKSTRGKKIKTARKDLIYVLSVCGLLHMSTRDFESARGVLERARSVAFALGDEAEVAIQLNNLGRVFLEFSRVDEAIRAFNGAREIDERLGLKYGLAYDLRNLGTALLENGRFEDAERQLTRALELSREVKDNNNELRALFMLGELMRRKGELARASRYYELSLPLAERFEVKELAWQILHAKGMIDRKNGDDLAAERHFHAAISVVRTMSGRAVSTGAGPNRLSTFEDLAVMLADGGRVIEALEVLEDARRLADVVSLDDRRIQWPSKAIPGLLRRLREASTATTASAVLAELEPLDPRLTDALTTSDLKELARRLPNGAAVVVPRATREVILVFVVDSSGVTVARDAVGSAEITSAVRILAERMSARADVDSPLLELSRRIIAPIRDRLLDKDRVAFVATGALRYVPFAALPFPSATSSTVTEGLLLDRLTSISALSLRDAVRALGSEGNALTERSIVAIGAAGDGVLPFANKEVELIKEEYPRSTIRLGVDATRASWLKGLTTFESSVHFAGHARLSEADPLGGSLSFVDGPLPLHELVGRRIEASMVVLSSCETWAAAPDRSWAVSGEEVASLAYALRIGGARSILATQGRVDDVAAAVLMKRLYRAARTNGPAQALRQAQLEVRRRLPHPVWWATFSLIGS